MAVSIRDIAREAGVTVGTVSRALNNYPDVSPTTRERIVETAQRLGYHPNPVSYTHLLLVTADDSCAPTGDKLSAVEIEAKTASSRLHSEDAVSIYSLACTYALLFSVGFPCWLNSLARAAIFCAGL